MANVKFIRAKNKQLSSLVQEVASTEIDAGALYFVEGTSKVDNTSVGKLYLDGYYFGSSIYNISGGGSGTPLKLSYVNGTSTDVNIVNSITTKNSITDKNYVYLTEISSSTGDVTITLNNEKLSTALGNKIDTAGEELTKNGTTINHKEQASLSSDLAGGASAPEKPSITGSGTTRKLVLPVLSVNKFGHVIAVNTSTLDIPDTVQTIPITSANTQLKVDNKVVKHKTINEINSESTETSTLDFSASIDKSSPDFGDTIKISIKNPSVNNYGHVIGKKTSDLTLTLPTAYSAGAELTTNGNSYVHKERTALDSTDSGLKFAPSINKAKPAFGETVQIDFVNPSVNKYGHVKNTSTSSISFTLPSLPEYPTVPVKSVTASGSVAPNAAKAGHSLTLSDSSTNGNVSITLDGYVVNTAKIGTNGSLVKLNIKGTDVSTDNSSYGDLTFSIDEKALNDKFNALKAKDQFLKTVKYFSEFEPSKMSIQIEDTTTSNLGYKITSINFTNVTQSPSVNLSNIGDYYTTNNTSDNANSSALNNTLFPALLFVWNTSTYDIVNNTSTYDISDATLVPIGDLKDPHYTFEDTAGAGGVVFTTTNDTNGNKKVTAKVNLSNYVTSTTLTSTISPINSSLKDHEDRLTWHDI